MILKIRRGDISLLERLKLYSFLWGAIGVGSDSRSKILLGRLYSHRKRLAQSKRLFAFLSSKMGVPVSGPVTFPIRIRNHDLQIRLDLDNHGDHPSFFEVFIEFKHSAILPLWQPELVIDAGAHVGFFSLLARTYYPNTPIHAFEPSPRNAAVLKWHSEMNRAAIQLHPTAVWSTSADLEFLDSEKSNSGRTVVTTDPKAGNLVVKGVSLVAELPEIGTHRCLIKMDIEGAELEVLPGLLPQLHQASVILMELHYTEKTRTKLETLLGENRWYGHMLEDNGVHSYWALSNSTEFESLIKRLL
jgi:FkbM family methyltransferase